MGEEFVEICDNDNKLLGIKEKRSVAHSENLLHRTIHVWIYKSNGEILLQLRSKSKDEDPNQWDLSVAGHVEFGEEPIDAAVRESKEEIGLHVDRSSLKLIKINKTVCHFQYAYLFKTEQKLEGLVKQVGEVDDLKFLKIAQIRKELIETPQKYVYREGYWSEMLSAIEKELT